MRTTLVSEAGMNGAHEDLSICIAGDATSQFCADQNQAAREGHRAEF
jgi:hypothetical protein